MYFFNTMLFKEPELNRTWQLTSNELTTEPAGFRDTIFALKQLALIKQQIKAKAVAKLIEKQQLKADVLVAKNEQKMLDEFSANQFFQRHNNRL